MNVEFYQIIKLLHIVGAIIFIGNIIVTAVWKVLADRTRQPEVVAFGQRLVTLTDFAFTGLGAAIIFITGFAMIGIFGVSVFEVKWITWGFVLFIISGLIWATILIPVQVKQARLARTFQKSGTIPEQYWRLGRIWVRVGFFATLLPLVNLYFMVFKPV